MLNWYKIAQENKILYIMRGISGSGKSTKAKLLPNVSSLNIFSTDDLIATNLADYNRFFSEMMKSGDFSPLAQKHNENITNAVKAMQKGVSPIVIDDTMIEHWEAQPYVQAGLKYGYEIQFVDVGTGGLTIDELTQRNKHDTPKNQIQLMMDQYEREGPISIDSVLKSKYPFEYPPILTEPSS
jgi:NEDD4-binding protein 2